MFRFGWFGSFTLFLFRDFFSPWPSFCGVGVYSSISSWCLCLSFSASSANGFFSSTFMFFHLSAQSRSRFLAASPFSACCRSCCTKKLYADFLPFGLFGSLLPFAISLGFRYPKLNCVNLLTLDDKFAPFFSAPMTSARSPRRLTSDWPIFPPWTYKRCLSFYF